AVIKAMSIMVSSMPSAINTIILSQKFGRNPEETSSIVLFTTFLSPLWLFIVYILLKSFVLF
ncbi:MAG: AEC family transporter, partial [bacterium]|nr:AEC family transporter [bacterium]